MGQMNSTYRAFILNLGHNALIMNHGTLLLKLLKVKLTEYQFTKQLHTV